MRKYIKNKYSNFLSKVKVTKFNDDSCWSWQGATKGNGYGNIRIKGRNTTAHRYSYYLFVDSKFDLFSDCDVCHTCDNRWCVNPDHLFIGTRKDNMQDMVKKGRGDGGSRRHLLRWQYEEIMARLNSGHSARQISNSMDLSYSTVNLIEKGVLYNEFS